MADEILSFLDLSYRGAAEAEKGAVVGHPLRERSVGMRQGIATVAASINNTVLGACIDAAIEKRKAGYDMDITIPGEDASSEEDHPEL